MRTLNSSAVICLFFGVLAAIFLNGCGQEAASQDTGTTFADAKNTHSAELRVLYVPAAGFAYQNEAGELTGVSIEIMRDFVSWFRRYHGIQVELNFVPEQDWSRFYQRVTEANGGVFGVGNVTITNQRRQELAFSPPYLNNLAVLITPQHIEEINRLQDISNEFAELQPLAFAGTLHETRIRELRDTWQPNHSIALTDTNEDIINRVASGDYYSYIDAYNYWRAVEAGVPVRHHPIANDPGEAFGIVMPHNNDWNTLMTAFFAAEGGYRGTPRYRTLLQEHLGEGVAELLKQARVQAN